MNVRIFLLFAATALFGALWSSDQRFQETRLQLAHTSEQRSRRCPWRFGAPPEICDDRAPATVYAEALVPAGWFAIDRVSDAEGSDATGVRNFDETVAELMNWGLEVRGRMEAGSCQLRWQIRRTIYFAQRRAAGMLRRQPAWHETAAQLARDAMRNWQLNTRSAAAATSIETR
jgi:hypothetical protein